MRCNSAKLSFDKYLSRYVSWAAFYDQIRKCLLFISYKIVWPIISKIYLQGLKLFDIKLSCINFSRWGSLHETEKVYDFVVRFFVKRKNGVDFLCVREEYCTLKGLEGHSHFQTIKTPWTRKLICRKENKSKCIKF